MAEPGSGGDGRAKPVFIQWVTGGNDNATDGQPKNFWRLFKSSTQAVSFYGSIGGGITKVEITGLKKDPPVGSARVLNDWKARNENEASMGRVVDMRGWPQPNPAATEIAGPTNAAAAAPSARQAALLRISLASSQDDTLEEWLKVATLSEARRDSRHAKQRVVLPHLRILLFLLGSLARGVARGS